MKGPDSTYNCKDGAGFEGCESNVVCCTGASGTDHSACPAVTSNAATVTGSTCTDGACAPACATGKGNCDDDYFNGCETDVNTATNCGACGTTCDPTSNAATVQTSACTSGACVLTCATLLSSFLAPPPPLPSFSLLRPPLPLHFLFFSIPTRFLQVLLTSTIAIGSPPTAASQTSSAAVLSELQTLIPPLVILSPGTTSMPTAVLRESARSALVRCHAHSLCFLMRFQAPPLFPKPARRRPASISRTATALTRMAASPRASAAPVAPPARPRLAALFRMLLAIAALLMELALTQAAQLVFSIATVTRAMVAVPPSLAARLEVSPLGALSLRPPTRSILTSATVLGVATSMLVRLPASSPVLILPGLTPTLIGNCDGNAANGCETDLSQGTHCGSCTESCTGVADPVLHITASSCNSDGAPTPTYSCSVTCSDLSLIFDHKILILLRRDWLERLQPPCCGRLRDPGSLL